MRTPRIILYPQIAGLFTGVSCGTASINLKKTDERTKIEEDIKKADTKINELVYEIYGITEDGKQIIESGLK